MKTYNLKITNRQTYLVEIHIFELCNYFVHGNHTEKEIATYEEYDQMRIRLYRKFKRLNKTYYLFTGLTEEELRFIGKEIDYWTFSGFDRDKNDKIVAQNLIKKISDTLDLQKQREDKLNFLLS